MIDRERAQRLNHAIDEALLDPGVHGVAMLYSLAGSAAPVELAERVRRRAVRLGARARKIASRGDELMAAIYAAAPPRGWFNAWCDGSSSRTPPVRSGVAGLVRDPGGRIAARIAHSVPGLDPFAAEIAALAAVLQAARDARAKQIRVHTDCLALARLWDKHRADPRLDAVRARARAFRGFALRAIPRAHNRAANRLARAAMTGTPAR